MKTVRARDGVDLHVAVHDYTDPWREAPILLLQHGFGRSGKFWFNLIPYLSRFYRVICPDLRGIGQSVFRDGMKSLSLDSYLSDLTAIVDAFGAERIHIAGESQGGILSLAFAARQPERVRTVSVFSPPLFIDDNARRRLAAGHPTWEGAIEALGSKAWAEATIKDVRFPPDADPAMLAWHAGETGKTDTKVLAQMAREIQTWSLVPELGRITAPVLAFYPSAGTIAATEQQSTLLKNVKTISLIRLPARYHMVQALEPAKCATHLLHFIAQHDGVACRE
jgi:pimeloyl-ACP methyl ester carboxylesterase